MSNYRTEHKRTRNTSTRAHYGYGKQPVGLTIHHWGSDGQRHENVVTWLTGKTGNRGTSAHEVISAGLVTVLAPPTVATWHAGSTPGNGQTMGLECRPEMSAADWDTLVERCADLEERLGSLKYYGHKDWKNTACPGDYYPRIAELVDAINAEHERRKTGGKPKPKPSKPTPPKNTGDLTVDGKWGEATTTALQRELGTPVDGEVSFQPVAYRDDNPGLLSGWDWTSSPRSSNVIEALQDKLGVAADGRIGPNTITALQRKLGTPTDGVVSNPSLMVKELQRNLNAGKLW